MTDKKKTGKNITHEDCRMTIYKAQSIKQDFVVAMQFADICGKTRQEAYTETAKKYSAEALAEAMIVLNEHLDKEKETNYALFALAVRSKEKK